MKTYARVNNLETGVNNALTVQENDKNFGSKYGRKNAKF